MAARLPTPGGDDGDWGDILNQYLEVAHNGDGTLQTSALSAAGAVTTSGGLAVTGTPSSSNFLRGDGTWAVPSGGGASGTLAGDTDVTISSPGNNQVLTYNSSTSKWVNQAAAVTTVAGKTGAVTLTEGDISNLTTDLSGKLAASSNLSDLQSASQARTNLGLGAAAIENVGTSAGTVMAGNQAAGGDLSGTLPSATVAKINGITLPASAPSGSGQVLTSTSTSATAWQAPGSAPVSTVFSRTGAVTAQSGDYTAAQVGALPSTDDLSAIASANATASNVSMNSHKVTNLSNGSSAQDAVAFNQLPAASTPLPLNQGGTGVSAASNAGLLSSVGAAPVAGATFTGFVAPAVNTLTFGASIAVNAALGNVFALTLTASTGTLANPTNPLDGQVIRFRVTQGTGGSFTLAYGTAYDFGTVGAPTLTTTATKIDVLAFEYLAAISKWCYLGVGLGF